MGLAVSEVVRRPGPRVEFGRGFGILAVGQVRIGRLEDLTLGTVGRRARDCRRRGRRGRGGRSAPAVGRRTRCGAPQFGKRWVAGPWHLHAARHRPSQCCTPRQLCWLDECPDGPCHWPRCRWARSGGGGAGDPNGRRLRVQRLRGRGRGRGRARGAARLRGGHGGQRGRARRRVCRRGPIGFLGAGLRNGRAQPPRGVPGHPATGSPALGRLRAAPGCGRSAEAHSGPTSSRRGGL
mmetsp:Transcript_109226/g.348672  ORF Transcript_109226/g.348672 Transcript_109226/m.348672 type:complete len:237 (+) Transcript_109226:1037-1747(+)